MSSLSGLKIKTNVVKRLFKEEQYYLKEVESLKSALETYKSKPEHDEYEAKQMQRAIDETEQLLPDCRKRLLTASNELSALVKQPNKRRLMLAVYSLFSYLAKESSSWASVIAFLEAQETEILMKFWKQHLYSKAS